MAQIRDIRLEMGQQTDLQGYAEVRFSVEFSESELRRNMHYGLFVGLFYNDGRAFSTDLETNGAFQTYLMPNYPPVGNDGGLRNGGMGGYNNWQGGAQFGIGQSQPFDQATAEYQNGLVSWIARETLPPAGTRTHHIERRTTFDIQRLPNPNGDYRALVWVVPEISQGQSYSNPVFANGYNGFAFRNQFQPFAY